jgi:hypothetical protein
VRLGSGSDSLGLVFRLGDGGRARPELAWRVEQGPAQVLQPQAVAGHGEAAPSAGGPVEHGPDQGDAAGLAGEPADDLGAAAGLAEGALDEVRVADAVVVLGGEVQVGGQAFAVGTGATTPLANR